MMMMFSRKPDGNSTAEQSGEYWGIPGSLPPRSQLWPCVHVHICTCTHIHATRFIAFSSLQRNQRHSVVQKQATGEREGCDTGSSEDRNLWLLSILAHCSSGEGCSFPFQSKLCSHFYSKCCLENILWHFSLSMLADVSFPLALVCYGCRSAVGAQSCLYMLLCK